MTLPTVWMGVVPPVPTCAWCGAVAVDHGPVIKAKRLRPPSWFLATTALLIGCASPVPHVAVVPSEPGEPALPLEAALILGHDGAVCSAVAVTHELVFTAGHCVDGPGPTVVLAPDGTTAVAVAVGLHPEVDFAVVFLDVELPSWAIPSPQVPAPGDPLWVAGYGCLQGDLEVRKLVADARDGLYLPFDGRVCPGDSGSPVFDRSGAVVGVAVAMCIDEAGNPHEPPCGVATLVAAAADLLEPDADADVE